MTLTLDDFHDRGDGYFVRRLDDDHVEIVREDGFGFGSAPEVYAEDVIARDKANPAPATGYRLADMLAPQAPADVAPEEVAVVQDEPAVAVDTEGIVLASGQPDKLAESQSGAEPAARSRSRKDTSDES